MTKKYLVLVFHGSPVLEAFNSYDMLVQEVRSRVSHNMQVVSGVLEHPNKKYRLVDDVLQELERGFVFIQPILLFEGDHFMNDVPRIVKLAEALGHSAIHGSCLGTDKVLIDYALFVMNKIIERHPDHLLFVGRGSSYPKALDQALLVANQLSARLGIPYTIAYAGISKPDIYEGLWMVARKGARRLAILPYMFHEGVLVKRVEYCARQYSWPFEINLLTPIGNASVLASLIARRALETSNATM